MIIERLKLSYFLNQEAYKYDNTFTCFQNRWYKNDGTAGCVDSTSPDTSPFAHYILVYALISIVLCLLITIATITVKLRARIYRLEHPIYTGRSTRIDVPLLPTSQTDLTSGTSPLSESNGSADARASSSQPHPTVTNECNTFLSVLYVPDQSEVTWDSAFDNYEPVYRTTTTPL